MPSDCRRLTSEAVVQFRFRLRLHLFFANFYTPSRLFIIRSEVQSIKHDSRRRLASNSVGSRCMSHDVRGPQDAIGLPLSHVVSRRSTLPSPSSLLRHLMRFFASLHYPKRSPGHQHDSRRTTSNPVICRMTSEALMPSDCRRLTSEPVVRLCLCLHLFFNNFLVSTRLFITRSEVRFTNKAHVDDALPDLVLIEP